MQDTHTVEHVEHLLTSRSTPQMCKSPTLHFQHRCVHRLSSGHGRRRVFILGPSHHVYLAGCALSSTTRYETPLYNLEIDQMST